MRTLAEVWERTPRRGWDMEVQWRDPKQLIGIEIEAESTNAILPVASAVSPAWECGSDGSLRNGYEYRLSSPLNGSALSFAIQQFFAEPHRLERALTSGTHIHLDMMEETTSIASVQALVLLVYMLEPAIYRIVDAGREWCGYTNGLETAPAALLGAVLQDNLDDNPELLRSIAGVGKTYKYYGLNIQPLSKFGSVEFRYFPTATSSDELIDWIQLVQSFKVAAVTLGGKAGVSEILLTVSSYEDFINNYLSAWAGRILSTVSYDVAVKRYHQALFTHQSYKADKTTFNPAVMRSAQFRKFAGKAIKTEDSWNSDSPMKKKSALPEIAVESSSVASLVNNRSDWSEGALAVGWDGTYMRRNADWTGLTHVTAPGRLHPLVTSGEQMRGLVRNRDYVRRELERRYEELEGTLSPPRYSALQKQISCVNTLLRNLHVQDEVRIAQTPTFSVGARDPFNP